MNYKITHSTQYKYSSAASHTINIAKMMPPSTARQSCHVNHLEILPSPTIISKRVDYFGNQLCYFSIEEPHANLEIIATSEVTVLPKQANPAPVTCAQVRQQIMSPQDKETLLACEYILASPFIRFTDNLTEQLIKFAKPLFNDNQVFLSAVDALNSKIFHEFKFDSQFSSISTPLQEIFLKRRGVCQDFSHIAIACLRALGFPVKYISGYIETIPPPGKKKLFGADASHAWFSVYVPQHGWFDFDPTNNKVAGEQHIVTAWGRDYSDVSPLKGMVFGGGKNSQLTISVDVSRIDR